MKTYTMTVDKYGDKRWYVNGKLHREGGPAVEFVNGDKQWYTNGKLHRELYRYMTFRYKTSGTNLYNFV